MSLSVGPAGVVTSKLVWLKSLVEALRLLTPQRQTISQPVESDLDRDSQASAIKNKPDIIPGIVKSLLPPLLSRG